MPTAFLVKPPTEPNNGSLVPPILALHGAGLDIFDPQWSNFWLKAVPRQRHSWIILPSGRTSWGFDWHGPSAREALATVDALHNILSGQPEWGEWRIAPETKFLLMGHSNGGQGAWYLAARHPERVIAVVPAAGYIKSQSYVSWAQSRSAHYVDPGLRAILDSSLTPDDNDLFLSNLVDTPVLAIHGGDDDNVPVWHTREAVSVLKTWNTQANVTFREDPGQGHWYDDIFLNDQVKSFVTQALEGNETALPSASRSFTLTVTSPADVGSLHGWCIRKLRIPGRLARLSVEIGKDAVRVWTTNVNALSLRIGSLPKGVRNVAVIVDGQTLELDEATWDLPDFILALAQESGVWIPYASSDIPVAPPTGRIANLLTTSAPMVIVIPDRTPSRLLSAALRIAHALDLYHKLDAEIVDDEEAMRRLKEGLLGLGNMVILSSGKLSAFATTILDKRQTSFGVRGGSLELRGRLLNEPSMATLFLHPHPVDANSLILFIYGADLSGLERGLRLFPIRTGVTVPDWIVIGSPADERGSGGVEGAGVWGNDWSWNEAMSAF
ncbi:alpha/beta-hydrolase [Polyporus arcularius HHB13444]|uniref:Alpha/beta-hydrolase n=1 Tax=Polyporus arcularius HHB13444 TaxID=1314778 RepID=A0A5C3P992_9APHY|nr:alpha/beta-hydrolase [Polyporus arcularius HHB13444]